jgi:hypothetical protein
LVIREVDGGDVRIYERGNSVHDACMQVSLLPKWASSERQVHLLVVKP